MRDAIVASEITELDESLQYPARRPTPLLPSFSPAVLLIKHICGLLHISRYHSSAYIAKKPCQNASLVRSAVVAHPGRRRSKLTSVYTQVPIEARSAPAADPEHHYRCMTSSIYPQPSFASPEGRVSPFCDRFKPFRRKPA